MNIQKNYKLFLGIPIGTRKLFDEKKNGDEKYCDTVTLRERFSGAGSGK
jgi:hypothetical protein